MVGLFCDTIGFNRSVHARIVKNMKAKYGEDFDMFGPPELAPFNKIPALVFHDVDDRDTPITLGRENGEKMANGTYIETSDWATDIFRDSMAIEQIMKWSFNISQRKPWSDICRYYNMKNIFLLSTLLILAASCNAQNKTT